MCLFFYHNIKDNERNLCQDLLTIENTDSDLKVHGLHYANELFVRVRLLQTLYVSEKSKDAYSLSVRVQTTINHISIYFFTTISTSKNMFFFQSASCKRHCIARHIDASSMVIFDWFVLSMRKQVILDSSFARPGSAPTRGGKKGEFRDWTILMPVN